MKKIIALVLILMMILSITTAMTEDSPKVKPSADTKNDTSTTTNTGTTYTAPKESLRVVLTDDNVVTAELVQKLTDAGADKVLDEIPEDITKTLPAGFTAVNEISTWKVVGDIEKVNSAEVTFKFTSPYTKGDTVYLLIYTSDKEWLKLAGKADDEGNIVVTFNKDTLTRLGNDPFVVVVVSKA